MRDHLVGVRLLPFLVAIALTTLTFPIRAIRWKYLLPTGENPVRFTPLWHATAIGGMANNLLPARAGELARAYAGKQLLGVRFMTAFASIAVERVLDGLTLVGFMAVAIWAGGFTRDTAVGRFTLGGIAYFAAGTFVVVLVLAVAIVHWPRPAEALTRRIAGMLLPDRIAAKAVDTLHGFLLGFDALRRPRRLALAVFWSLVHWTVAAASFWLGMTAFGIDVPWSAPFLLQSLVGFAVALPAAPGFWGPFEAVMRIGLSLYAVPTGLAVSFAIGFHLGGFIPITLLGLWSLSRAHVHLADLRTSNNE